MDKNMKPVCRQGVKIFAVLLSILSATTIVNAQQINWANSTPCMASGSEPLTVLGDSALLEIDFTVSSAPVTQAKVEIKLPQYLEYANSVTLASGSDPVTWTTAQTGDPTTAAGRTLTISVTSNGNSLPTGTYVKLRVRLRVLCGGNTITNPAIQVRVLSNTTPVAGGTATAALQTMRLPVLNLTSPAPNQTLPTQNAVGSYTLNLTATNGEAHSAKITLTTDLVTTLDNFTIDGNPLTVATSTGSTQKTYTLTLTPEILNYIKINATPHVITFELTATRCGVRNITSVVQYRHDSNCATYTGMPLAASCPAVSGLPNMVIQSCNYLDAGDNPISGTIPNHLNHADIKMDGITPTYVKTVFKNDGTADAYDIQIYTAPYGQYMYIDTANIKYQVEGGAQQLLPSTSVRIDDKVNQYLNGPNTNGIAAIGYAKPEIVNKPRAVTLTIADIVPAGKTLTVWVPTVNGKIYDNGRKNVVYDYWTAVINGYRIWVSRVRNRCMETGTTTTGTVPIGYTGVPHFREMPVLAPFKSGTSRHQAVRTALNHIYNSLPVDVYVKLPSWLTLNNMYSATLAGNPIASTGGLTSHGNNTFSLRYTNGYDESCYMHFDYTADACAGVNRIDTIEYWINQIWLGGTLDHVSQLFQPVTLECVPEGIALNDFGTRRTTKGLKDSDNNSIPDDGTIAPDNEILHNTFIESDHGYFYWDATVTGVARSHLYLPIRSLTFRISQSGATNLNLANTGTISINGGAEQTIPYTILNDYNLYLHYQGNLPAGANLKVKLPFTVREITNVNGTITVNSIETKCYLSDTDVSNDPMSNDQPGVRFGKDRSATPLAAYSHHMWFHWNKDALTESFPDNTLKNNYYIGFAALYRGSILDVYQGSIFPYPYFANEVRRSYYPYKGTWELPEGYLMDNMQLQNNKLDLPTPDTKPVSPATGSTETRHIYNLNEMYDTQYDGSNTLTPGKWMLPDDKYILIFRTDIRATRGAPLGNSTAKVTGVYKHPITGEEVTQIENISFIYTGLSTQLSVAPTVLDAYSQALTLHTVTIGNPNKINLQDVYLYVAGNVQNVRFKNKATSVEAPGIGNGRWFKVSNQMPVGTVLDYEINFDYTGTTSCDGDTVRVYTAAGFDQPWAPNTSVPLVTNDWDHVGARKMTIIRAADARVTGNISVAPNLELSYNTPFTLTVDVYSTASPGILRDPSVMLSVPPGMQVVPGSARIEYPLGTAPRNVTGTFLPALNAALGAGSNLSVTRSFTLNFDQLNNNGVIGGTALLMPGSLAMGVTPAQQTARFTVDFLPMCETTLAGLRFSGVYNATSSCGAAAQWNGMVNRTRVIYTDVPINYHFSATVQTTTGNRAFNELRRRDTVVVEIQKTVGITEDMPMTDSLHLVLPATMDLDGFVTVVGKGTMQAGVASFTPSAADCGITANERHINISLPITAYNAETNKGYGVGNELVYRIPVIYTSAGQTLASNPVNQIEASVQTNASIDENICPDQRAAIGGGEIDIALVTARQNPDRVTIGTVRPFEITSVGFIGNWYADSLTTTPLATAIPTYTPAVLTTCDSTKVFVSALFGSVNYGRVPLLQTSKIVAVNDTVPHSYVIPYIIDVIANDTLPAGCAPDTVHNRGPRHGTLVINPDRTFTYTPEEDYSGTDSIDYYIKCETDSSAARVYVKVLSMPDNIVDANCAVPVESMVWAMSAPTKLGDDYVSTYQTAFTGDMDGDGNNEIVVAGKYTADDQGAQAWAYSAPNVYVFSRQDNGTWTQTKFNTGYKFATCGRGQIGIARPNASSPGLIVVAAMDGYLYAYNKNGTTASGWTSGRSDVKYSTGTNTSANFVATDIKFADFNGDGHTEIVAGDRIFDLATGKLLYDIKFLTGIAQGATTGTSVAVADINKDGRPELIWGKDIYSVDITNRSGTIGNDTALIRSITPPAGLPNTSVTLTAPIDIDLDGNVDIFVNGSSYFYIYDPRTGVIKVSQSKAAGTTTPHPGDWGGGGTPFLGDIDGDGYPEIMYCGINAGNAIVAWDVDAAGIVSGTATRKWRLNTTDASRATGLTLFDFDQDEKFEIVYRDQTDLRILNGFSQATMDATPLSSVPCTSGTLGEYPIIADVDNDEQAEIIISGGVNGDITRGNINIYKAGAHTRWAPARTVWNQYSYNVVNIKKDLTVPKYMFDIATIMGGRDSIVGTSDDLQPFNGFLKQQTVTDQYGNMIMLAPNAIYNISSPPTAIRDGDSIRIEVCFDNIGDASLGKPVFVSFYRDSISTASFIKTDSINDYVHVGHDTCLVTHIKALPLKFADIVIRLNDRFRVSPYQVECEPGDSVRARLNPALSLYVRKDASIGGGTITNGRYPNPVAVLYNENIKYQITAFNANTHDGDDFIIRDTLPAYLDTINIASATTDGGAIAVTPVLGSPGRKAIRFTFPNEPKLNTRTVSFYATPVSGAVASQPLFVNYAVAETKDYDHTTYPPTATTNRLSYRSDTATYHQGAGVAIVTFSAGVGGIIFGHEPQAVDYRTTARTGVVVAPDDGFRFAGWSHPSYISLRGDEIPAADGIMSYDTLTIYGNVELRAEFVPDTRTDNDVETLHATSLQQPAIWSHKGELFVKVDEGMRLQGDEETRGQGYEVTRGQGYEVTRGQGNILRIYTSDGILYKQQTILNKGITTIKLPSGIYICTLNNGIGTKVTIN
jgi:hypothetical protein